MEPFLPTMLSPYLEAPTQIANCPNAQAEATGTPLFIVHT